METAYFENLLDSKRKRTVDAEEFWNGRAEQFKANLRKNGGERVEQLITLLSEKNLLKRDGTVLDIGCGIGRHAVEFAEKAGSVVGVDISANMLHYARENSLSSGADNIEYVKLNWEAVDLSERCWEKYFDLVFASMCPAVRSKRGLEKMSLACKDYCFINQYIEKKDSLGEELAEHLGLCGDFDPHNDRDAAYAIFNILWLEGYDPEITYLDDCRELIFTVAEAVEYYDGRLVEKLTDAQREAVKPFFRTKAQDNIVQSVVRSKNMGIFWKA
ncbi:class I SAM-dependent methyltransferase [Desulfoscipio sp. XC116]|uniref:class I SAM-dependent methyltransferase n=1 Tax=Desulfoscipio sp. XC116 TaxID=3144975 RepID=UPI00325A5A56